jgi:hypothetical protein
VFFSFDEAVPHDFGTMLNTSRHHLSIFWFPHWLSLSIAVVGLLWFILLYQLPVTLGVLG